jgi:hypothetical protein
MNARCINCLCIRTEVRLRAGWASAEFVCVLQQLRRTHLGPGQRLKCHSMRESNTIPDVAFDPPDYLTHPAT